MEIAKLNKLIEGNISITEDKLKLRDDRILTLETKETVIIGTL